ncbi:SDR family NAD(P)-dependent oxidoreductase [Planktotalea sp.]|uniref:SDR family NAD(P)-dependent oxidoreductase n=1 Tax=Planktotalea sp. TaxID=2029877 RepID=UPI0032976855
MKSALISGGAGGLGRALTTQLISKAWHVTALDLDVSALESHPQVTAIELDLTDGIALKSAMEQIIDARGQLDLVIYNAGVSHISAFEHADEIAHRHLFEINYFAAVNMARHCLHAVRAAQGTHLAISSVAGFSPLFHRTAYSASKHALEGFFSSLRSEEAEHGVYTLIAAPSFVGTNLGHSAADQNGMQRPGSAADGLDYMTPDDAAAVILSGYEAKRPFIPVGRVARLAWWIDSLAPRVFQRLMERNIKGE